MSTSPVNLTLPTQDFASKSAAVLLGFITRLTALKGGTARAADFTTAGELLAERLHKAPETLTPSGSELSESQRSDISVNGIFPPSLLIQEPSSGQFIIPPGPIKALATAIFDSLSKESMIESFLESVKKRTGIEKFKSLSGDTSGNPLASTEFNPANNDKRIIEVNDDFAKKTLLRTFTGGLMIKSNAAIVLKNWLALQQYKSPENL